MPAKKHTSLISSIKTKVKKEDIVYHKTNDISLRYLPLKKYLINLVTLQHLIRYVRKIQRITIKTEMKH